MYFDQKMLTRVYYRALIPNMAAILGGTINVLFDGILVGRKMGELGIASVNQSLAVYLLLCTVGSLIASGAFAESAAALGENRQEEGQRYYSLGLELAAAIGILLCAAGFLLSGPLARSLESGDSWELVETYIRITFLGGVFKILLYVPFFYLRLAGKTDLSALAMMTMTALNILLDYVFLYVFDFGIGGAAWASVLATMVACGMSFGFLIRLKDGFRFRPVRPRVEEVRRIVKAGSPTAANNLCSAFRIVLLNQIMDLAGGSGMVAAFAVTNNLNEFSICIQNGVPQAGSAMLGIYQGEQDPLSVKKLLKIQLVCGFWLSSAFAGIMLLAGGQVGRLFGSSMDLSFAVGCLGVGVIFGTLNSVMTYYYYATMKSGMANLITVLRVLVVTVAVAWWLKPLGDGIFGFYWLAELVTGALWIGAGLLVTRRRFGRCSLYMLDETAFREGKCINFTVACDNEAICEASEKIQDFCQANGFTEDQTMTISLALEELMVITAEKSMHRQGFMDVRILRTGEGGILRIRSEGKRYNSLEYAEAGLEYLGVSMIMKMAKKTEYQNTLGLNTLIVVI
nr:MATE family efflux transporter [uncultured Acetatifactor sp.]